MKKVLYFAYGSNLKKWRLDMRVDHYGTVTKIANHRLFGYKLLFNAEGDGHNFANIVKGEPSDYVDGVLYSLNEEQFKHLDSCEGLYYRYYFDIDDDTLGCTYICTNPNNIDQYFIPEWSYLNVCIEGAHENHLTELMNKLVTLRDKIDFERRYRPRNFKDY